MSEIRAIDSRTLRGPKTTVSTGGEVDDDGRETKAGKVLYVEYHRDPARGRVVVVPAKDPAKSREIREAPTRADALVAEVERAQREIEADEREAPDVRIR